MDARELRIGNYIKLMLNQEDYEIIQVALNDLVMVEKKQGDYEQLPLTEEWLLDFGAGWNDDYVALESNRLTIRTHLPNMKPSPIFAYFDGIQIKQLRYVHQLQNLYFALTGKELTPKN